MTVVEKGSSKVKNPNEPQPGTSKEGTRRESRSADRRENSRRKESDLISTATSALRRLNFRSAGGSHARGGSSSAPAGPPLQQMGSSTTSETTTNTSTDSATTGLTIITTTDAEQEERMEVRPLMRSEDILLNNFDELFAISEREWNAKMKGKAGKSGHKKGKDDSKKPVTTVTVQDKAEKGKFKKHIAPPKKGKQASFADDKQPKNAKMSDDFLGPSTSGRDAEGIFSMEDDFGARSASPPTPPTAIDKKTTQNADLMPENGNNEMNKNVKMDKPKTNIRTIQSGLPQRTFTTNFNKRKKVERGHSQAEVENIIYGFSPETSPKNMDDTRFPFPPRNPSPIPMPRSSSPRLKREMSTSLRKLSDTSPINRSGALRKPPTHTAVAPLTLSNLEKHEMQVSQEGQRYQFGSALNLISPINLTSPTSFEKHFNPNGNAPGFELPICTSPTESQFTFMDDHDSEDQNRGIFAENFKSEDEKAAAENYTRMSHKRKKRHDQKSSSLDTSDEETKFTQSRKSRDAFLSLVSESEINSPQSRKYSILTTDGSVKNFVSENSEEFKKTGENINKENINMKNTARRGSECPQRHRRVSIIQGESLRHFIFEEPDTSRMKPSKQRKVSKVIEDTTRSLLLEDVHPRNSSLAPGDTMKMGDESPRKSSIAPDDKPRKFSINTLGDIVSARKFSLLPPGEIYTSQVDGKTTEIIKLAPVSKGKPLATIVVQQASIQRGSISGPSGQREDSFLDVANTFTLEELHEFDMKYGSPHHCRSQSVKTPGRSCGRPNYLCLPQQRARVASMPNTGVEEEYYRLRNFSITGKGLVNRGDSLKSRRSRSNNSVASSNSSHSTDHVAGNVGAVGSCPGSGRNSGECSLASSRESSTTAVPYKVLMLGGRAVGKTSLISQFMTSEYLHAYDTSLDEEYGEKSISVIVDGHESELVFIDYPYDEMPPEECITAYQPDGYIVVYSVTDSSSFETAEQILQALWRNESIGLKAVIMAANKVDLVRNRSVTYEEGIRVAESYDCKYIETSVGINHNVDELLVGILSQIKLKRKLANPQKNRSPRSPFTRDDSPRRWRNTRLSASLRVKGLLGKVWSREVKKKLSEEEKIQYQIYKEEWLDNE